MNEYEVKIKEYVNGNIISGRKTGNKIKNDFLKQYEMGIKINLNFDSIENTTHSFIDELIGAFMFYEADIALERIRFTNCNEDIKELIKFVIIDRVNHDIAK